MATTTLLMVIGSGVCLKTLAFVGFAVLRGRRQRRELGIAAEAVASAEAAASAAAHEPVDPCGWRLQWAEPGVMLVENTSEDVAARDVELRATLTASSGTAASIEQAVRFVGTGASFTARFAELERWLADAADAATAALGRDREAASRRLGCTLSYSMAWLTPDGERRRESRVAQAVVPLPDLA